LTRKFLAWLVTENKSAKTIEGRRLNLQRFLKFMGNVYVLMLDIQDLEKFRAKFKGTLNRRHHEVGVKALLYFLDLPERREKDAIWQMYISKFNCSELCYKDR
jgi:hypothetical protein